MIRRALAVLALLILIAAPLSAVPMTVSRLPSCTARRASAQAVIVDGDTASDCTLGGGSYIVQCWCDGSAWAGLGGGVTGAPGADGCTLLSGTTAPAAGTGKDCDFYLRTTNSDLYGPKTSGAWGSATSIKGATGAAGSNGTNGTNGTNGLTSNAADFYPYDPDAVPTLVSASSDEFDGSISGNWRWANQGSATDTYNHGSALMTVPKSAGSLRVRWVDAPSATDFTVTTKMLPLLGADGMGANYLSCGLILLVTGTEGTPTKLYGMGIDERGVDYENLWHMNTYTDGTTWDDYDAADMGNDAATAQRKPVWLQLRYTASTKNLAGCWGYNGVDFVCFSTTITLTAHPISVGRYIGEQGNVKSMTARFFYFRTRTDANRNESGQ